MTLRPAALAVVLTAAAAAMAGVAGAQEIIQAGPTGAPPESRPAAVGQIATTDPETSPQAIGAWARGVMAHAGQPDAVRDDHPAHAGCTPPPDRKPQGEVWAGVGTHGYREGGAAVTAPLGDCGQATIVVDETRGPDWRR